jgi:hypothetical protein
MQSLGVRCGINQRAAQEILGHSDANLTAQAYAELHLSSCTMKSLNYHGFQQTELWHNTGHKIPAFRVLPCHPLTFALS